MYGRIDIAGIRHKVKLYTLLAFDQDNFAESLKNEHTPVSEIRAKNHFTYLNGYLSHLNAKVIIIEDEYISNDYLHDYSYYYSTCFARYKKYCKRLHFFNLSFGKTEFDRLISHGSSEISIKEAYLGFLVVKPIPHSVIGFTVLKTYDTTASGSLDPRNFWATRLYTANLFGISLSVESLAFQEQDSVVSACATTSIWSMLHGAIKHADGSIALISQAEITSNGGYDSDGNRIFPNHGLELSQIADSIVKTGLVCEIKTINDATSWLLEDFDEDMVTLDPDSRSDTLSNSSSKEELQIQNERMPSEYVKKILNAYSSIGVPIILILSTDDDIHETHAVTVSGFFKKKPDTIDPKIPMSFLSDNIVKFYAHDDQWGPFVRILFLPENLLHTTWTESEGSAAYVSAIVISLYPQIRISYVDIEPIVRAYDRILSLILNKHIKGDLVWDIRLLLNKDYREQLKNDLNPPAEYPEKARLLTSNLPKYIWNASCYIEGKKTLDFAFDATGINQAMLGLHLVSHFDERLTDHVARSLEENRSDALFKLFRHNAGGRYYEFFLNEMNLLRGIGN